MGLLHALVRSSSSPFIKRTIRGFEHVVISPRLIAAAIFTLPEPVDIDSLRSAIEEAYDKAVYDELALGTAHDDLNDLTLLNCACASVRSSYGGKYRFSIKSTELMREGALD